MKTFRFKPIAALAATLVVAFVAGCTTTSDNSKYQTRGGGWDNFRAEAPAAQPGRSRIA